MGNRAIATVFEIVAEVFWAGYSNPTKDQALAALDAAGNKFKGADANSSDAMMNPNSPLGKMIALAFDATPEELDNTENESTFACPWFDGPHTRFRQRYNFC